MLMLVWDAGLRRSRPRDDSTDASRVGDRRRHVIFDGEIERELRERFGPDELTMELEGPEIVWMKQEHLGECKYRFEYRVAEPGLYRLVAWSYRGGFESINEVQGGSGGPYYFPPIRYDDLVGEWAWIDLKIYPGDAWVKPQEAYSDMDECRRGDEPGR